MQIARTKRAATTPTTERWTLSRSAKARPTSSEPLRGFWRSRAAFLTIALLLISIVIGLYARERWLAAPLGGEWLLVLAAPLLGMMIVGASVVPGLLWKPEDPHPYDVLEYHLQIPREWYEAGRIVPLHHNVFCYFPNGVELHY